MFDTLSNREIMDVLSNNFLGRLACYADGKSYIVPISYAYDGDYIYARSFEGMKLNMMRKNPNVCLQVDKIESMSDWQSVIIWGTFEELTDNDEREKGLKILLSKINPNVSIETLKSTPEWPFPTNDPERIDGIVFRIHITETTGRGEELRSGNYRK